MARARSMLSSDLDSWNVLDGYRGPVKIQLCTPWALAATLELPQTMNAALADPGAVADLTASLAEGAAELAKRVPGAQARVRPSRAGPGPVSTAPSPGPPPFPPSRPEAWSHTAYRA
jgi:hypothetical protein